MLYEPALEQGRLLKRYKRFLCDVRVGEGKTLTMHCPNTGSMKNCCPENALVWFSKSDNSKRKYAHTWELVETHQGHKIGINTHLANKLVVEALLDKRIDGLKRFDNLLSEVKYGEENSRIDILLERQGDLRTYIEVKSVTLLEEDGWGYFPDSVSVRGQKHLRELMHVRSQGHEAVLFFCVQHTGIRRMKAAAHIDPDYANLLKEAKRAGVKIMAYTCHIDEKKIFLDQSIKVSV